MSGLKINQVWLDRVLIGIIIAWVLYQLAITQYLFVGPVQHKNIHLAFGVIVMSLGSIKKWPRLSPAFFILIIMTLFSAVYVNLNYNELTLRVDLPTIPDMAVSVMMLLAVFVTSYIAFGTVFAVIGIVVVLYVFFGQYLPGVLHHMALPVEKSLTYLSSIDSGVYGSILSVSANYIFLFLVLGGLFEVTRSSESFTELGKLAANRLRGGPAIVATIGCALMGMVTGAVAPNIAVVGSFSLPLMKKVGYKAEQAAAVTAAASSGGQIMPPIMGASGFVMAALLGISYAAVTKMAYVPAILYFLAIGVFVQFMAVKMGIRPFKSKVDYSKVVIFLPIFIIPIAVIMVTLLLGYTPMFAGFWGIVITIILTNIRKSTRISLKQYVTGCVKGATLGAQIAVTSGLIGMLVTSVSMTGLAVKLSSVMGIWAHGSLLLGLIITMVIALILGTGLPTVAGYVIVAIVLTPALVKMGIGWEQAHMFVMFYAVFSNLTPPVAIAALISSTLAKASYMKTCWEGMKIATPAFITPFIFVVHPEILLLPSSDPPLAIAFVYLSVIFLFASLAILLNRAYLTLLKPLEVVAIFAAAALFGAYLAIGGYTLFIIGIAIFAALTVEQIIIMKRAKGLPLQALTV